MMDVNNLSSSTSPVVVQEELAKVNIENRGIPVNTPMQPVNDKIAGDEEKAKAQTEEMVKLAHQDALEYKKLEIDEEFLCDPLIFDQLLPELQDEIEKCQAFDTGSFLTGVKGAEPTTWATNQNILENGARYMQKQAKRLVDRENLSLEHAYKILIGALDHYDQMAALGCRMGKKTPLSTFVLRSALLLASQKDGIELLSWMVYTKAGKPIDKDKWTFLDDWKNWVPEAQAAMAKFSEVTIIRANALAEEYSEFQLILLKGGFGAGKTRLAKELMNDQAAGVVAPDLGKWVVRRSMETVPHSVAHVQGSQIAYKLFDNLLRTLLGTLVYDSSLSRPADISSYLKKSQQAKEKKKVMVYDVARHDMARILAVLKREVGGDDPRVPPNFIINSAMNDKLHRVECMEVILNYPVEDGVPVPEYHFMCANDKGWNSEKMMVITPNNIEEKHPEMRQRLAQEGIEIDQGKLRLTFDEDQLETYYTTQFERPVRSIMEDLSREENEIFFQVFSNRILIPNLSKVSIHGEASFYDALPGKIKQVLSESAFQGSFASLKEETRDHFFQTLKELPSLQAKVAKAEKHIERLKQQRERLSSGSKGRVKKASLHTQIEAQEQRLTLLKNKMKTVVSYLDLPLRTALIIHQKLGGDPWV